MGIYGDEPRGHKPAIILTQKELQDLEDKKEEKARKSEEKGGWWNHLGKVRVTLL